MTDQDTGSRNESAPEKRPSRQFRYASFDAAFFAEFLQDRARALCARQPDKTAVVLLHLADGAVLDLCHIERLYPDWMAVMVYHDPRTCERMDLAFVPYALITRVTVSMPSVHQRRIGFQTASPPALSVDEKPQ